MPYGQSLVLHLARQWLNCSPLWLFILLETMLTSFRREVACGFESQLVGCLRLFARPHLMPAFAAELPTIARKTGQDWVQPFGAEICWVALDRKESLRGNKVGLWPGMASA